jgi:hypothetical protein
VRKRVGRHGEHRVVGRSAGFGGVAVLPEQEPVLRIPVERGGDERPRALEPLPVQTHGKTAVPLLLEQLVRAAIPDLDRPRAVLTCRDGSLEIAVFERVILDVHGQPPLTALERDPLRNGPTREDAVAFETEVVVEASRVVALDHEAG